MSDVSKKICAITGASSGIGAQCAIDLAAKGHPVLLMARRVDKMKELVTSGKIPEKLALIMKVDVTKLDQIQKAVAEAEKHFGGFIDLLINNAGCMNLASAEVQEEDKYQMMVGVNLIGVMNGVKAVVPGMKERKTGTVMNVSSIAGRKGFPNHVNYCATKFGVHGLSLSLRAELQPFNVRCIIIAPGVVSTELLGHNKKEVVKGYKEWMDGFGGDVLVAKDVSDTVLFAYGMPQRVNIREIALASTSQDA